MPLIPPTSYCRTFVQDGIKRIRVEDNNGAHVIREMSGRSLQSANKQQYRLDGPKLSPASESAPCTVIDLQKDGVYVVEFDRDHDFTELYSTIDINYPKLVLQLGVLPAATGDWEFQYTVQLLQRQIITPAIITR